MDKDSCPDECTSDECTCTNIRIQNIDREVHLCDIDKEVHYYIYVHRI